MAEAFLAFASELDGLYCRYFVVACGVMGIDQWIMVKKVNLIVEKSMEDTSYSGMLANMFAMASLMVDRSALR